MTTTTTTPKRPLWKRIARALAVPLAPVVLIGGLIVLPFWGLASAIWNRDADEFAAAMSLLLYTAAGFAFVLFISSLVSM